MHVESFSTETNFSGESSFSFSLLEARSFPGLCEIEIDDALGRRVNGDVGLGRLLDELASSAFSQGLTIPSGNREPADDPDERVSTEG